MSIRPITDVWILSRPKVKYYGAYPNGFLERARHLLPVRTSEEVLHVCSGMVTSYPGVRGIKPWDVTLDINPDLNPDIVHDMRMPIPDDLHGAFRGVLIDRPYTLDDARRYGTEDALPSASQVLENAWPSVMSGGRIGILDYEWARPPREAVLVASIGVVMGYGNRIRVFAVYEKP